MAEGADGWSEANVDGGNWQGSKEGKLTHEVSFIYFLVYETEILYSRVNIIIHSKTPSIKGVRGGTLMLIGSSGSVTDRQTSKRVSQFI